jgi:hypothetical protein
MMAKENRFDANPNESLVAFFETPSFWRFGILNSLLLRFQQGYSANYERLRYSRKPSDLIDRGGIAQSVRAANS